MCRYYLRLHPKAPIAGLQGDMGWLLPKYRHIIALFRTWNRFAKLTTDRIVAKVLKWNINMVNGWSKQSRDICHTLGCIQPGLGEVYDLELIKKIVQSNCQEHWLKNVSMKPKLRSYVMFKNIFKSESYVKIAHSKMSHSIFAQFRLGILPLEIETGRFRNIPSENRVCHFCKKEIEDELHFVCVCPVYSYHRNILFNEIILTYNNFSNLDIKFRFIMATGTECVLNYVENAWNTRKSLLYAYYHYFFKIFCIVE